MNRVAKQRPSAGVGIPSRSVPETYRELLIEYRHSQLQLTAENLKRLEGVFDRAVAEIAAQVRKGASGNLQEQFLNERGYYQALMANLEGVANGLRSDLAQSLEGGMLDLAQNAAQREAQVARLAGVEADGGLRADLSRAYALSDGASFGVTFGRVALSAVERVAHKVYADGWNLSDRLYRLDAAMRKTLADTLVQGVAEQISAAKLANRLEDSLTAAGSANARYDAMRIARTEIVTAHREAHIQSTLDPETGGLKSYILAVGYRLSVSHPHSDICDIYADDDGDGLGNGNYLPDNFPGIAHPHCLCYSTTVLVEHPDVSAPSKTPEPDEVSESQAQYYVAKYDDPAARRWLEKRANG